MAKGEIQRMIKKYQKIKPKVNPYDLSTIFLAIKHKLIKKNPKYVNPYDCNGSAQYGKFKTDEG